MTSPLRRATLLGTLGVLLATAAARADDRVRREPPPAAIHLVGHEDAALLRRVQDVIDDWDPRKLVNPYTETVVRADPARQVPGRKSLRRPDLNQFIADVDAAEALGKAFFWEMQAGSDFRREQGRYVGTACASCHFRFGADSRNGHTTRIPFVVWDRYGIDPTHPLEYGEARQPYPVRDRATEPIGKASSLYLPQKPAGHTPRREPAGGAADAEADDPAGRDDDGPRTPFALIVGSAGVPPLAFEGLKWGNPPDAGTADWQSEKSRARRLDLFRFLKPEWSMFVDGQVVGGKAFRQITTRNSPTTINAAFSDRLFHDGRAESTFNGFSIFGDADNREVIHVRRSIDGRLVPARVAISKAALASQAVGPVVNEVEMSYLGRTFHDLAAKLLDAPVLGHQEVADDDSHLGRFKAEGLVGPKSNYRALIRRAFRPEWWDGLLGTTEQDVPLRLAFTRPGEAQPRGTLMEANFSLYWGLSILLYEASLISNDSPFDRMMQGDRAGVERAWGERRGELETIYIDRVRTNNPPPDGLAQFPFKSGSEVFQRGFRTFLHRGCVECHSGPLFSEGYERADAAEAKAPIAFTLERTLLPNSQGDAIAIKIRERHDQVFQEVVGLMARAHPEKAAQAGRVTLELERLLEDAAGSESDLTQRLKDGLAAAGFPQVAAAEVAARWIAFEKTRSFFSGDRHFFGEDERIAAAALLVDPVLSEKMNIPPNQVGQRRPLPVRGPLSGESYAFYDMPYYVLGVAPPRYDRGNGGWSDGWPADDPVAEAEAARVERGAAITEVVDELARDGGVASTGVVPNLKGKVDLGNPEAKAKLAMAIRNREVGKGDGLTPADGQSIERAVAAKLEGRPTRPRPARKAHSQAASGTPGSAYRFDPRWKERPRRAAAPGPVNAGATPRRPGDPIPGPPIDLDEGLYAENPRDLSWFRNLPDWDRRLPPVVPAPVPAFDSEDRRRSDVHFFSRTRDLVQDETAWGHRKPLLHDDELAFWGAFKTPTLRNVDLTPPYMHNGRLLTLMDVLDFYDRGGDLLGDRDVNPDKHPAIVRLDMTTEDKLAVVFFLICLSDDRVRRERAPFDHPSLRLVNGYDKATAERVIDSGPVASVIPAPGKTSPGGDPTERVIDLGPVGAGGIVSPRRTFPSAD